VPVSQIHAYKYQESAKNKENRNLLMQYKPGEDDGGDRIEIDVVGSHDSAQLLEHPVPCQETQHGGHTATDGNHQEGYNVIEDAEMAGHIARGAATGY
jgi:hypothetical protein